MVYFAMYVYCAIKILVSSVTLQGDVKPTLRNVAVPKANVLDDDDDAVG